MRNIALLLGVLALLPAWTTPALAQSLASATWGGGNGDWFGSSANWVCPVNGVLTPCAPPAFGQSNDPFIVSGTAYIGGEFNGLPLGGAVTTNAPFSILSVGIGAGGILNFTPAGNGSMTNSVFVDSQGTLNVTGGGILNTQGFNTSSGSVVNVIGNGSGAGGRDVFLAGSLNVLNGGIFGGLFETIGGNVTVDGAGSLLASSYQPVQINGNVVVSNGGAVTSGTIISLNPGGSLTFDIGGPSDYGTAVAQYDTSLSGTVIFNFQNGFAPMAGEMFNLISGVVYDTNATFEIEGLAPGFQYELLNTQSGLTLEALDNGITAAPEPASFFLILAALLCLAALLKSSFARHPRRCTNLAAKS